MSLRSYLFLMFLATFACFLSLLAVLNFFDPFVAGVGALLFFYASLFLTLVGSFAILGVLARLFFTKDKLVFQMVKTSFRQAVWFALLIVTGLHLKSIDLLVWKNIILLVLAFALLEIFFMSYKTKPSYKI